MAATQRELRRVLIVEDERDLRAGIARGLGARAAEIVEADSLAAARRLLAPVPDLVIVDLRLPDGPGLALVEDCARILPVPVIIAISGCASPGESFRLAQRGVRAYLEKPFSLQRLGALVDEAWGEPPDLDPLIVACVGTLGMREVGERVRDVMLRQALALAGSRGGAARLLQVTRQAVQQVVRTGRGRELVESDAGRPSPPPAARHSPSQR